MKKIYLLLFALLFSVSHYGQYLVAIDRTQTPGPAATAVGTDPNVSAIGLTRGPGLTVTPGGGVVDFSSSSWSTGALDTNDYLQWSLTSNVGYETIVTVVEMSVQRNNNGPQTLELRYSVDGFTTNTLAIPQVTLGNTDSTNSLFILPVALALSGQTVTFRLYGYNASQNNGDLAVTTNPGGAVLGIANPGIKIRGNVTPRDLFFSNNMWNPFPPSSTTFDNDAFVIDGTYTVPSNISLNNLNVESLGNVVIPTGILVIVNSTLLESSSIKYPSLIVDGTLTGIIQYDRHVNLSNGPGSTTGNNDLISTPLNGQTFGAFALNNTTIVSDPNNSARKLFGPFNKSTGNYVTYNSTTDAGVALIPGVGYRAASTDNDGFLFTGSLNNGPVTQAITNGGPNFKEWNLIGNPYPSYINLASFLATNTSQFDTSGAGVYGYDGSATDGWIVWNQAYADANPTAAMTPGQGFFVSAPVAGGNVSFTPAMRVTGNTDDFIAGRSSVGNITHLKLNATNGSDNYFTDFYLSDNASLGLDPGYDATIFGSNAPAFSIYSHLVQNNAGKDMAVQSIGNSDLSSEVIIPLGINASQGQQVTISIAASTLPSNMNVYLEDNLTGIFTLLNTSDYIFTPNSNLIGTGRFFLRFAGQTLSTPDTSISGLQIYATSSPNALLVKGLLADTTNVNLYDVQGRLVLTTKLEASSNANQIDVSNLSSGVYVVKLSNTTQQKTQKVILK